LRIAKGDLLMSADLDRNSHDTELTQAIRRNYLINAAASEVLAYIFADEGNYRFDEKFVRFIRPIENLAATVKEPHALLISEMTAFLYLAGKNHLDIIRKTNLWEQAAHLSMPLDRALFVAIHRGIIGVEAVQKRT